MSINSSASSFVIENIGYYREVTLAVKAFQEEVEKVLREVWADFLPKLADFRISSKDPVFKCKTVEDATYMHLETRPTDGVQIGLALQARDPDELGRFAAYSWVWVKEQNLRKALDDFINTRVHSLFIVENAYASTFITAYFGQESEAITLLRSSFQQLLECLGESPEFSRAYGVHQPGE